MIQEQPITLFCFPFAGGNRYSFNRLKDWAGDRIRLVVLEWPGRGARQSERLLTELSQIEEDVFSHVVPRMNGPFAFWGHSMGALVAFLVTRRMALLSMPSPIHLFVSGCRAPSLRDQDEYHRLPRVDFYKRLEDLGGSPAAALMNTELMSLYEPVLRADFKAVETFKYKPSQKLNVPITVMIGQSDSVSNEEAIAWRLETRAAFSLKEFSGGHFFIFEHKEQLMNVINSQIT